MAQNQAPQQLGSIPILEASVTVCRDIPGVLLGKIHWIEWIMFCDQIDEALKPLRALVNPSSSCNGRRKSTMFRFHRRSIKTKVIKNLQQVCDKEAQRQTLIIQNYFLYCPLERGDKARSVTNWHIQVVVRSSHPTSSSDSFAILDSVPTSISVPSSPTSTTNNATPVSQWQSQSLPFDLPSYAATRPPLKGRFSLSRRNINSNIHNNNPPGALLQRQASNDASSSIATNEDHLTNPFSDDPNDSLAMSRDGLMELDGQMDWEDWGKVPTMPADMSHDQMPIPMPPPAPFAKVI